MSWLLTLAVDTPAKDFAYALDMQLRLKVKKKGEEEKEDERPPCWKWMLYNWSIWIALGYFLLIITIAEIYNAAKGAPNRYKGVKEA